MKIHLISDIHLERGTHTIPSDLDFDVLVAAGDVCEGGVKGVEWLIDAAKGKPVIYVPGNHEYYCPRTAKKDRADILNEIRAAAAGTNIHVLDGDIVILQDEHGKSIRFIGATLWTNLGEKNESLMRVAGHGMRDYYMIQEQGRDLFHTDVLDLHEKALEFFQQELAKPFDGQTICVSHHHPSLRSLKLVGVDEEHIDDTRSWSQRWSLSDGPPLGLIRRASYASDLTNLLSRFRHDISVWMCGHLHAKLDYVDAGVRVMCNPKGASGWETHGFDSHCNFDTERDTTHEKFIAADLQAAKPDLVKLHTEIKEFSTITNTIDGLAKQAVMEAIGTRSISFSKHYKSAVFKAIANLSDANWLLERSPQHFGLHFNPKEKWDKLTGMFPLASKRFLHEETLHLLQEQQDALSELDELPRLPLRRHTDACRRIAFGLHALRATGYRVDFYWTRLAIRLPWRHALDSVGNLHLNAPKGKEDQEAAERLFNSHLFARVFGKSGFSGAYRFLGEDLVDFEQARLDPARRFADSLVDAIVNVKTPGLAVKEKCDARGIAPDSDNISNVISGQAIDRNAANELSEFLGKTPQHWLDIQKAYDRKLEAIVTQAMASH